MSFTQAALQNIIRGKVNQREIFHENTGYRTFYLRTSDNRDRKYWQEHSKERKMDVHSGPISSRAIGMT